MNKKKKNAVAALVLAGIAVLAAAGVIYGSRSTSGTGQMPEEAGSTGASSDTSGTSETAVSSDAESGGESAAGGSAENAILTFTTTANDQKEQGYTSYTLNGQPAEVRPELFSLHDLTYNGKNYTRTSAVKAYLFLGVDNTGSLQEDLPIDKIGLSDGIFLMAYNTAKNTVKIISIPRDTMTSISVTDENNQVIETRVDHINYAWMYGDGHELSGQYASEAVSNLLGGLPIDRYMAGSVSLIGTLADCIGGVPITIGEEEVTKASDTFQAGETVVLKGDLAEKYVRYRDITEDFTAIERLARQKKYIVAFENQLIKKQKEDSQTIPDMMDVIEENVITDMQKGEYLRIALDITSSDNPFSEDDIEQIGGESVRGEQYDEFYPDYQSIDELVLKDFYHES